MKKLNYLGIILSLSLLTAQSANAIILTFDDHANASQNAVGTVGDNYNGFNFSTNLEWIDTVGSSWNYGAVSGEFTLLNNLAGIGYITEENGADFSFGGLWARSWGDVDTLGFLAGYNDGDLVWEIDTSLNGTFDFFGAQTAAIDELHLGFGNYFLVDDLELNSPPIDVPEPAQIILLLLGLAGIAFSKRKMSKVLA